MAFLLFVPIYLGVHYLAPAMPWRIVPFSSSIDFVFSPDGKSIAAAERVYPYRTMLKRIGEDETYLQIHLLDPATGKERFTIPENSCSVGELGFSSDGRVMTAYSEKGDLQVRDALSGSVLWTLPCANLERGRPRPHFTPDSRHFVLPNGPWEVHRGWLGRPHTRREKPRKQTLFNTESGREEGTIEGEFQSLTFSPDSRRLVTWQRDEISGSFCVRLWDGVDLGRLNLLHKFDVKADQLFFLRDLNSFAVIRTVGPALTKAFELCEMTTGKTLSSFQYDGYGDGRVMLLQAPDRTLILEQSKRYDESSFFVGCETNNVRVLGPLSGLEVASPDCKWYAVYDQEKWHFHELNYPADGGFISFDVSRASRTNRVLNGLLGTSKGHQTINFSPHDRLAAIASFWDRPGRLFFENWIPDRWNPLPQGLFVQVAVWDMENQRELLNVADCERCAISPDETMAATVGRDNVLKIWRLPPDKAIGIVLAESLLCWLVVVALFWRVGRSARQKASVQRAPHAP